VAVVLIGTNNLGLSSVDEIVRGRNRAGITAVYNVVHTKLPKTRVLLLGVFPRGPVADARRGQITQINAQLSQLNVKDNITFLDVGYRVQQPGLAFLCRLTSIRCPAFSAGAGMASGLV
jgi:hypothetical protein